VLALTIFPEDGQLSLSAGIVQPIAKWIGTRQPYPVYAFPFRFRGEQRTLQYTLFALDDARTGSSAWLRCLSATEDQLDPYFCCTCCPEFTQAEELFVLAAVAADATKPGDPMLPEDCR